MKTPKLAAIVIVLASAGFLFAQTVNSFPLPKVDGIPAKTGEKGSLYAAASEDALWIKAGGNSSNPWVKFNFVTLGNAVRTNLTLVAGTASYTNANLSTNAMVFATSKGTSPGFLTTAGPNTNGVVTVTSSTNSATNAVNLLILD